MIKKVLTISIICACLLLGTVALAETNEKAEKPESKAKIVATCVKPGKDAYKTVLTTAGTAHATVIKEANEAYKIAQIAAKNLTDKPAKKAGLSVVRKAMQSAKKIANKDLKEAKNTARTKFMADKKACRPQTK